jgi:hypothetical protein
MYDGKELLVGSGLRSRLTRCHVSASTVLVSVAVVPFGRPLSFHFLEHKYLTILDAINSSLLHGLKILKCLFTCL